VTKRWDLIVVGGGPAGSTLAGLVKKHDPKRRVLLLERESGPRHHVGESLLPGLVPVLKELGVFEKIDAAGFPRKIGANYVWGRGREVWENDFNDVNVSEMLRRHGGRLPDGLEYAWQVRRSVYDEILLTHAESLGVEVLRGAAAEAPIEAGGSVVGLTLRRGGRRLSVRGEFLADCSGQQGFLARFRPIRRYDERLKNLAVFSYWKGAPWKYTYSGHPDKTKIFVCSVDDGWFWYIPIDDGVVSVGLVTSQAHAKSSGKAPEALYEDALARCAEIAPLLSGARRVEDFDGTQRSVFTVTDWSYLNVSAAGPGWLACGDAAVFVDPILSSGVTLAHTAAHRAAYTLLTRWDGEPAAAAPLWDDYNRFCRESAAQFLALALFWYGNDRRAESWWAKAAEIQRAWAPLDLSDHAAFIAVSAGLTRHFERAMRAADLACEDAPRPEDYPFYGAVLGRDAALERRARVVGPEETLRLAVPYDVEVVYVAAHDRPRLRPVKRVRFRKSAAADSLADAGNPRRLVTRYHLAVLQALDGRRTVAQALAAARSAGAAQWWLDGPALEFLRELRLQAVLEPAAASEAAR
jgi:flavin-dependent dehydrogenase